jgi:hypothetical protein
MGYLAVTPATPTRMVKRGKRQVNDMNREPALGKSPNFAANFNASGCKNAILPKHGPIDTREGQRLGVESAARRAEMQIRAADARWLETVQKGAGGEGGIRTPDTVARTPHFECGAFNHSATSPEAPKAEPYLGARVF